MENYNIGNLGGRNDSDTNHEEILESPSALTNSRTNNVAVDKFQSGDKVFAKVQGFPYWPGKICGRSGKSKYSVRFYGSNDIVDCNEKYICDYLENREALAIYNQKKLFSQAIAEIEFELEPHLRRKSAGQTFESSNFGSIVSSKNDVSFSYPDGEPTNNIENGNEKVFSRSGRKIKPKKFADEILTNGSENQVKAAEIESTNVATTKIQKRVDLKKSIVDKFRQKIAPSMKHHLAENRNKNNSSKTVFLKNISNPRNKNNLKDYPGGNILETLLGDNKLSSVHKKNSIGQKRSSNEYKTGQERISNGYKIDHERKMNGLADIPTEIKLEWNCSKMDSTPSQREEVGKILPILKVEVRLVSLEKQIREYLSNTEPDFISCLKALDDVFSLNLRKGMLLKHPEVIDTLVKLTRYVGITNSSRHNGEQVENMPALIRSRALKIYNEHLRKFFPLNEGESFIEAYQAEHQIFMKAVSHLDEKAFFHLT